jgi:predicted  nucleic acid-binding Zn-ribbon protein
MREQLNRIDAELAELTSRLAKSTDAARANAQPKLEALRDKASALRKQLDTVETSTESSWNEVKVGVANGYEDLKDGFRQARQWVSDAIAP